MCVFLYLTYHRFTNVSKKASFRHVHLPACEGWYAAFLKIRSCETERVVWSTHLMLPCTIVYADLSESQAYLSKDGKIYLKMPSTAPPDGANYDPDRETLIVHARATQSLSSEEIQQSSRGVVKGLHSALPNNGRRISHIMSFNCDGVTDRENTCVACLLPETNGEMESECITTTVSDTCCFSPHIHAEAESRYRRRFTIAQGQTVVKYLSNLFTEMHRNDEAVRYVISKSFVMNSQPCSHEQLHEAWQDLGHHARRLGLPKQLDNCRSIASVSVDIPHREDSPFIGNTLVSPPASPSLD